VSRLRILVLHGLGDPSAAPVFLTKHVAALRAHYPEHEYVFHDTTVGSASELIGIGFDAVVLDVTLLAARWAEDNRLEAIKRDYAFIKDLQAVKVALPQDEYDCNAVLDEWMCEWNVDVVFSVIDGNWDVLYPKYSQAGTIRLAYTGYIDDSLLYTRPSAWAGRPIDIGYRARKLPPYFGALGDNKWRIGEAVKARAIRAGFVTDIVVGDGGALLGHSWLKFINDCKFSLGANSGSSLLDPTGSIQRSVRAYLKEHPQAPFEEVEEACFAGLDREHEFTAISPRVLEAGMLESCQILVEGAYSGILKPWEHYIPIRADASDFDDVAEAMRDHALCARLIANCKSALLDFKALRYESYAKAIMDAIAEKAEKYPARRDGRPMPAGESGGTGVGGERQSNVLLLVAHEPERDPRCAWIAAGVGPNCVVHQLGVSRIPNSAPTESGSRDAGFVWSIPRRECIDDLGVIKQLIFSAEQSRALLEFAALISIRSVSERELRAVLDCGDSARFNHFRWHVSYILDVAYTLIRHADNLVGVDAIIATDLDTLLAGVFLKERFKVPLIYDAHEFWPAADVDQAGFEHDFWVSLEKRLVSQVDYAQTVTPGLAAHMTRLYGVPFFCTPNAEPIAAKLPAREASKNTGKAGSKCRFLFQGGFAPARGIDILIKAWPRTDSAAVLVLRGPDNEYRHDMIRLAKSLGIHGTRVIFAPAVDESQLVAAAAEFDVGLIPYTPTGLNYANCCPNKLSQYMAAGLPVLAFRTTFVEQVVRESGAGAVVDSSDTEGLVREVNRFVRDPDYRNQCSVKSEAFFVEGFHWEVLSRPFFARLRALVRNTGLRQAQQFGFVQRTALFESTLLKANVTRASLISILRRVWRMLPAGLRYRSGIGSRLRRVAARFLGV
jgi:glycosyltransferase involved in cell wall biosynthesis